MALDDKGELTGLEVCEACRNEVYAYLGNYDDWPKHYEPPTLSDEEQAV